MSLLMDALKKAEQAKRQALAQVTTSSSESPSTPTLQLDPIETGRTTTQSASIDGTAGLGTTPTAANPDVTAALSVPDSDFLDMAPPPPMRRSVPSASRENETTARASLGTADRATASNVFAAKHADAQAGRKRFALITGSFTTLAVLALVGYFWWQMQPKGTRTSPVNVASPMQTPAPVSASTAAPIAPTAISPASTSTSAVPSLSATTPSEVKPAAPAPSPTRATASAPRNTEDANNDFVLLRPTRTPLRVDPHVQAAFDAFARGDLVAARRAYELALANDPNNSDALHGLARVARREERTELAEHWLRKALIVNPKDGAALAGLLELFAAHQPSAAEPRLRALTTEYPALPEAHVALANLYTRNQRWHEAQQSWFAAYTLQPENADILFNLAVSLEHLNQPRLARQYYSEALKATRTTPGQFDPVQAAARVRVLAEQ